MNEALGRLRKRRPTIPFETTANDTSMARIIQFPLMTASDDPGNNNGQREIQHVVERAVDELPDAFRIVFVTRVIEGMSVEETAELLELRTMTVKTRLHRARKMLRDSVERQIGPIALDAFPFAGRRCDRLTRGGLEAARPFKIIGNLSTPAASQCFVCTIID